MGVVTQGIVKMEKLGNLAFKKYTMPTISATSSYINQEYLLGNGLRAWAVALVPLDVCGGHKWHMSAWGCRRAVPG